VDAPEASVLAPLLRQALAGQGKLASESKGAPVRISVGDERREKHILALSGGGKVREYRLVYKVSLKVRDSQGNELIAPVELRQVREFSYDDALILAKEAEEASLNRAMEQETLRQVLRRLSYVKR
jgi:LPS-assembly lipoprotein